MTAQRSKSVPATRSSDRTKDAEEDTSAFPELQPEQAGDHRVPTWIQELANARAGRHSRASSIVSTRTRFSTTTMDDARSIDIEAGGQTFHISRFGDRITDATAPPPYSGPNDGDLFIHGPQVFSIGHAHDEHPHGGHHDRNPDQAHFQPRRGRRHHGGAPGRRGLRRVRIAMPNEDGATSQNEDEFIATDTPSRVVTDDELRQIIIDLPSKLKSVLGIAPDRIDLDGHNLPDLALADELVSRSRNPISAFTVSTTASVLEDKSTHEDRAPNGSGVRGILRNAPDNAPYHTDAALLDSGESRWVPLEENTVQRLWNTYNNAGNSRKSCPLPSRWDNSIFRGRSESSQVTETDHSEGAITPPTVGDLNELSQVYNKVIRDLDREHRKQLHGRDKELEQLRILLHEKDIVYRQQLKGRDFVIDELKQRLDRLEETMEVRIERATHEVEDLWETRWKEHSQQLMEKCGLFKPVLHSDAASDTQTDATDTSTI